MRAATIVLSAALLLVCGARPALAGVALAARRSSRSS